MPEYVDYICSVLVRIFNSIFHFLPIRFTLWLGRQCGRVVYIVNKDRRTIGYANLRAAFCKEKTPLELKEMIKKVYISLVEIFFEILSLTKVNQRYIDKYIDIVNPENMLKIAGSPHGIILLTAHFGNWELSGMVSVIRGFPLIVLAREQKMRRLNELINRLRESKGLQVVRKGITTKYIVKALHQGKMIGVLGDQDAGKTGIFVEFFGRPTSTAPGTVRIASKTGAYILPAFIARVKGPYHKLILEEPIKVEKDQDIRPYLEKYNKLLEKCITMYPDQWLWLHKRWKSTPLKKVIVLSDGKPGHLNQAMALCKQLKRYRKDSGYDLLDTQIEVVEVKFKNKLAKMLLNLASLFSSSSCQGCMRCLKLCLRRDSYENLMQKYSDIVISCGSSLTGINRLFSIENNAKNAVIMRPSILGLNKFNMVVLPWHDTTGGESDNVIITDTVPNLIDEEYLEKSSKEIASVKRLERPVRIGVLLGGDNSDFALTDDITKELLDNIIDASNKLDADVLFTTSRRTPEGAERKVKYRLGSEKRCKFLVIANEENNPFAVGGILGLSNIIVVSGESVSMVSEAVSSGKIVVVFRLKKKKKRKSSKFERMLHHLKDKGYIVTAEVEELSDTICRSFYKLEARNYPQDRDNVYKHMWRLL